MCFVDVVGLEHRVSEALVINRLAWSTLHENVPLMAHVARTGVVVTRAGSQRAAHCEFWPLVLGEYIHQRRRVAEALSLKLAGEGARGRVLHLMFAGASYEVKQRHEGMTMGRFQGAGTTGAAMSGDLVINNVLLPRKDARIHISRVRGLLETASFALGHG